MLSVAFVAATLLSPRSGLASPAPSVSAQAATMGEWSEPLSWPGIGIHTALLPTGKVLMYSYPIGGPGSAAWLWDPGTGTMNAVPIDRNIFCSGQSFLPDGRLLVTGGKLAGTEGGTGIADTHIFDPFTEEWTRVGDMAVARWYPTNVPLPDGETLVFAGMDEEGEATSLVERYDPISGMEVVPEVDLFLPTYPWMHVLPSGKVFDAGPQEMTGMFDPATLSLEPVAPSNYGHRSAGTSVLLPLEPPDYRPNVLIFGGGEPATNTAEIIDLGALDPTWGLTAPMTYARRNLNPVVLPDGKVLVVGGAATGQEENPVLQAEIFDPVSETWTEVASMQRPRVYHSTAILLPDGRIVAAGSDGEFTAEIYSPPYLFQGPRPQLSSAPPTVSYEASFSVSTPDAQDIEKVVLISPAAVTHSVSMGQRYVALDFQAGTDLLTVQAPPNANLAPPGYYMLFAVNSDGVPSEATFVQLTAANVGAVGGIAELPRLDGGQADIAGAPLASDEALGSRFSFPAGAGALAAGAATVTSVAAAWWIRRRLS